MAHPPAAQTINSRGIIEPEVLKIENSDALYESNSGAEVEPVLLEGKSQKKRPILAARSKSLRHAATPRGHPYPTNNLGRTCASSSATSRSADRSLARFRPRAQTSTATTNARKPRTDDRDLSPTSSVSVSSGNDTRTLETKPKALFAPRFVAPPVIVSTENDSDSESTASETDGEDEMGDEYNGHFDDDFAYLGSFRLPMS